MATRTTNLNLYKPTVGGDTDNWGGFLNNNAAYIDALFAKSSAAVTLHVNNQQIDGTSSYLFDSVKMGDNRQLQFGAAPDYWLIYDSSNTQFELNSTNVDGGGTDGVVFSVSDGTDDVAFTGKISTAQVDILAEGDLRLQDASGGEYVGFDAPATVSGSYTLTLPAAVGSSGQILRTSDGSGTLEWVTDQEGDITEVVAGAGLTGGGAGPGAVTLNAVGTSNRITVNADDIDIASTYVGQSSITTLGTITTGVWNGTAIANANLANSTVSYGGVSVALGASDATPAFNLSDATAYTGDSSLVASGALNSGSITSGFGAIDVGSSAISGGAGTLSSLSVGDGNITNVGDIALDSISSDGSAIAIGGTGDTVTCNGAWIFNESSADVDFRIEGNGEANLFFVDAGNDRIGINTNAPTAKLHILQSAADYDSGFKIVGSDSAISGRIWMGGGHLHIDNATAGTGTGLTLDDNGYVGIGETDPDSGLHLKSSATAGSRITLEQTSASLTSTIQQGGSALSISAAGSQYIGFETSGAERAKIASDGKVSINGATANTTLNVKHAIALEPTDSTSEYWSVYAHTDSTIRINYNNAGNDELMLDSVGNLAIQSGAQLQLDGGGDTYITEGSANVMRFYAGGNKQFECSDTNLTVVGALSKGSGSFRIDHPLDSMKDTHDLVHSFVEGPRADLIYRGSVQLSEGTATVDLDAAATMTDGTWELLCRDPQVWVQNEDGWTQVRGSVSGSTLTITAQDEACTDTVSWLVVAERQDEHMMDTNWTDDDGRVIVEPEKDSEPEGSESEDDGA